MAQFDVSVVQSMLTTQTMGRKIIYQSVTGTTMDDALAGARKYGNPHGTAYIAELQTKARGSKGRQWNAKNSGNLYVSFIIHKDLKQGELDFHLNAKEHDLNISASMATMWALEEEKVTGISVKWLNDLWIRGHKLCGALTEYKGVMEVGMEQKHLFILGIGLNINCDIRRDNTMFGLATSTLCETGREFPREKLFARICYHLEGILTMERSVLVQMYRERQTLQIGQTYKATHLGIEGGSMKCKFLGLKDDLSIDLKVDTDEVLNVSWNQMTIRPLPEKCVYILTGPHIEKWSAQLLNNTFRSLIDTTRCDVRTLELVDGKALPQDCALIVVGQWKLSPDPAVANQITEYVRGGGACFFTGNSCRIFLSSEQIDTNQLGNPQISALPSVLSAEDKEPVTISLPCVNPQISLTDIVYENISVLASHSANKTGAAVDSVIADRDVAKTPDIIIGKLDKGKICLSGPSVEITYADVEEFFSMPSWEVEHLKKGIFHRDALILRVLCELGL